ncbi:MAG: glycoside hydrolase family 2 protein [Lentisphaeria bacterium]|nr:glycoside hydrolase family 2 protein [Lentisphaeria bacterium]
MKILTLNGKWTLQCKSKDVNINAVVPGDAYLDCLKAKLIEDPFYKDNELSTRWIGENDWSYSREFSISKVSLGSTATVLRCHGLDTLCTIRINGKKIASTNNMHRTWEFDIKKFLVAGKNRIEVDMASPVKFTEKEQKKRYLPYWHQAGSVPGVQQLRKEACNYGWDWGPGLPTVGIWRDIEIISFDTARIDDVYIEQAHTKSKVALIINSTIQKLNSKKLLIKTEIYDGKVLIDSSSVESTKVSNQLKLSVKEPKLWWPNGMGSQPLYTVKVTLLDLAGNVLDETHKRIGLRTLGLGLHKDKWGQSFQFDVNGYPFFAKGANYIPSDAIQARVTNDVYERLVKDSAAANMNVLRVWGGGLYEADAFYDYCDEYGICIWQDFMFACATYACDKKEFRDNVREEAIDNVKRLRHHSCIAMWCGNNELEQGLVSDTWTDDSMPWKEYDKLFNKILPDVVNAHDPNRDYWPASPHSPSDRLDFNNPNEGDAHLWSVWHGQEPFEWYRTCEHRFNSEFGFQSFPEPRTIADFAEKEDRNLTSYIMEFHQRSGIGNSTIMSYMMEWFRLPYGFENTVWLSQIQHGMAMKYAVEHWRRSMPQGMGTVYWQLNDCWPGPSWASIDCHGRWKACQYMARHFFNPLLISGLDDEHKL